MAKTKNRNADSRVSPRKIARSTIDVILGEAAGGATDIRYADMLAIASVIMNRARQLGVTPDEVVSGRAQFRAYGSKLPPGVEKYRQLAERALRESQAVGRADTPDGTLGRINEATYYATPSDVKYLPKRLRELGRTSGHRYFYDPLNRNVVTAVGAIAPDPRRNAERVNFTPLYNSPTAPVLGGSQSAPEWREPGGLMAPNFGAAWMRTPGLVGYPPSRNSDRFVPRIAANRLLDRTTHLSNPARQSYAIDFVDPPYGGPGDPWSIPGGLLGDMFRRGR
jgi:hypothetical protein